MAAFRRLKWSRARIAQSGEVRSMNKRTAILIASLPLAGLICVTVFLDLCVAATTNWIFVCTVAALGLMSVGVLAVVTRRAECLVPYLLFGMILIVISLLDTSPLKPFARFYVEIKPGMTEP